MVGLKEMTTRDEKYQFNHLWCYHAAKYRKGTISAKRCDAYALSQFTENNNAHDEYYHIVVNGEKNVGGVRIRGGVVRNNQVTKLLDTMYIVPQHRGKGYQREAMDVISDLDLIDGITLLTHELLKYGPWCFDHGYLRDVEVRYTNDPPGHSRTVSLLKEESFLRLAA